MKEYNKGIECGAWKVVVEKAMKQKVIGLGLTGPYMFQ